MVLGARQPSRTIIRTSGLIVSREITASPRRLAADDSDFRVDDITPYFSRNDAR